MPTLAESVRDFLAPIQGKEVDIDYLRKELKIDPNSPAWNGIRVVLHRLAAERRLKPSSRRDGVYKVITQVTPVKVYAPDRGSIPVFDLKFPRICDISQQLSFAADIVIREGDLILISGVSNYGKTTLCLNFCGENIGKHPVLMGNEYTTYVDGQYVPTPRFVNRLDAIDWVEWYESGEDRFTLLPVRDDYADHIVKDKINIIDWINIDTGEHFLIGSILEQIKKQLGRGIAIVAIQKAEGAASGRGGQFTRDFADLELLVDRYNNSDILMTVGKVKEYTRPVIGRHFIYSIENGVRIMNFREVEKCPSCKGYGSHFGKECQTCHGLKYIDLNADTEETE